MATAERACTRPQRIVFWPLGKPKTHMNITAVTPAQMIHAVESRVRQRRCQRCGGRLTSTSVSHRRGWYSDGPIPLPQGIPLAGFNEQGSTFVLRSLQQRLPALRYTESETFTPKCIYVQDLSFSCNHAFLAQSRWREMDSNPRSPAIGGDACRCDHDPGCLRERTFDSALVAT
jgi:hypothetical protein